MADIIPHIPKMLTNQELVQAMAVYPPYSDTIREADDATRLLALDDIYNIYHPSVLSIEVYNKIYLSLIHSLKLRNSPQLYHGISGGADSFSVLANSGFGKSTAVARAISLIMPTPYLKLEHPYQLFIPIIVVPCPFNCSLKSITLLILEQIDSTIGTSYVTDALRERLNSDMLISRLSKIVKLHIGHIVVEEIENLINNRNAKQLVGFLTQLINSGISISFVGTHQARPFIEDFMLARRMQALVYSNFALDDYFRSLCKILWSYQYVRNKTEIDEGTILWLYNHSQGIVAIIVSIIHDAQEIAILDGRETLNIDTLSDAFNARLSLLHPFIKPAKTKMTPMANEKLPETKTENEKNDTVIKDAITTAKETGLDIITYLSSIVPVERISVEDISF